MQLQRWHIGICVRLTYRQQCADFTEQVIADPHQNSFFRPF